MAWNANPFQKKKLTVSDILKKQEKVSKAKRASGQKMRDEFEELKSEMMGEAWTEKREDD